MCHYIHMLKSLLRIFPKKEKRSFIINNNIKNFMDQFKNREDFPERHRSSSGSYNSYTTH